MATETQKGVKISTYGTFEDTDVQTFFKTCFVETHPIQKGLLMFADEDGLNKRLPPNLMASMIRGRDLVGDVFLTRVEGDYNTKQLQKDFPFLFDSGSDSE